MGNLTRITFPIDQAVLHNWLVESQRKRVALIQLRPQISEQEMAGYIEISTTATDKHIRILREKTSLKEWAAIVLVTGKYNHVHCTKGESRQI
jgi:hypothetical protein